MKNKDDNGVALRRAVAGRLNRFFADWTVQLGAGTSQIWDAVQRRLSNKPAELPPAPDQRGSMQQPMQQQQSKSEPESEPH